MDTILARIMDQLSQRLGQSGIMFRIFGRVKSERSLAHKMEIKGEKYRAGAKIQDVIGIRVVLYFSEDVEALEMFLSSQDVVGRSVDTPDVSTFRPQRLNLVRRIPQEMLEDFRKALPSEYAPYIDSTYEIQVRTILSEGWHEVEHDMRYKCIDDWKGCDSYSRQLNGVIATLETAQWSMGAIFREMSSRNLLAGQFDAMLRNKLLLRLANDGLSPQIHEYLASHKETAARIHESERLILVILLLNHEQAIPLTFDNMVFLINRYEFIDPTLREMESPETRKMLDEYLQS